MRNYSLYIIIFFYIVVQECIAPGIANAKFKAMDIPVMTGGYQINSGPEKFQGSYFLSYFININYPASIVIEYYKSYFASEGWGPPCLLAEQGWISHSWDYKRKIPYVRQYGLTWDHPVSGVRTFMALVYSHKRDTKPTNRLHVFFRTSKAKPTQMEIDFFERLRAEKKEFEFLKLLDKYRNDSGEPDLNRAIRENPDNTSLRELKTIYDLLVSDY